MTDILTKATVLVLNRNWQAINASGARSAPLASHWLSDESLDSMS